MPGSPVEGERATAVVADQYDAVQAESVEPGVKVAGVVGEGRAWSAKE